MPLTPDQRKILALKAALRKAKIQIARLTRYAPKGHYKVKKSLPNLQQLASEYTAEGAAARQDLAAMQNAAINASAHPSSPWVSEIPLTPPSPRVTYVGRGEGSAFWMQYLPSLLG